MEKAIRKYGNVYRKALLFRRCREIEAKTAAYEARLRAMYASDGFKAHSVYPTTNAVHVYAVIAMCLELKAFGLTDTEIIETINHGFVRRRNFFRRIIRAIDLLPNSFSIAKKWNISDHDRRVQDGSITYDRFDVGEDRIEYRISKCAYVDMFEAYDIRSLCKIFCMTDTTSYPELERGESASKTGRDHVPPRVLKEMVRLEKKRGKIEETLESVNLLNGKAKAQEVSEMLDGYIPGVEKMATQLKKYKGAFTDTKAENESLRAENEELKSQLDAEHRVSIDEEIENLRILDEHKKMKSVLDRIPKEILEQYIPSRNRTPRRDREGR